MAINRDAFATGFEERMHMAFESCEGIVVLSLILMNQFW